MRYMLDTDICIYAVKGIPASVRDMIERSVFEGLCISSISYSELEFGIFNSNDPKGNQESLNRFLTGIRVLPFDDAAAAEYGMIRADLKKKGTPIGPLDTLIAAHARSEGLILVTNNTREFSRIPGLKLENWAE